MVDIQPEGRGGKRYRKTLKTKMEALRWEALIRNTTTKTPSWQPEKKDLRRLSDLLAYWYDHHGKTLKAHKNTYSRILLLSERIGNPYALNLTTEVLSNYRQERILAGITANAVNREMAYLRGAFNELIRLGIWNKENPAGKIKQLKIDEKELSYLTEKQIKELFIELDACNSVHVSLICKVCLATGARWSEALGITCRNIKNNCITFTGTKSGKTRTIPIPEELAIALIKHAKDFESPIFKDCIQAFRRALQKTSIKLPVGQASHVLRHSFASHFMMNGGSILTLQKLLGHQSLTMTMRYAHLSPDHLEEARILSPYAKVFIE